MGKFSRAIDTLRGAVGEHWQRALGVTVPGSYALVCAIISWLNGVAKTEGFGILLPSVSKVTYTVALLSVLLAIWMWKYAHTLRLEAIPKLRLMFDSIQNKLVVPLNPLQLRYIVGLVNDGSSYLTNCKIGLVISSKDDSRPLDKGPIYLCKPFSLAPGEPSQLTILTVHVDEPNQPAIIRWYREENGLWMLNPTVLSLVANNYDVSVRSYCSESRPAELLLQLSKTESGGWTMKEIKRTKDHPLSWFDPKE